MQVVLRRVTDWRNRLPAGSHKVLSLIERCHTAALGHHTYKCEDKDCGHVHIQYHGCRNRHCPHCGSAKAGDWMRDRLNELLPVTYYHVVFTLPAQLRPVAYLNRKVLFSLLFDASSHTLLKLSSDPKHLGATPSITTVLHTWGQTLNFHPHVHCIVSGGGADEDLQWKNLKHNNGKYLFPYPMMRKIYSGYFLEKLHHLVKDGVVNLPEGTNWQQLKNELYGAKWIIRAEPKMSGAAQVVEYLARYTQKVGMSNHRIKKVDKKGNVSFLYKDYKAGGILKLMTLSGLEFLRRYAAHILPAGFVRIRHYGLNANYKRKERLSAVLANMDLPAHPEAVKLPEAIKLLLMYGSSERSCPECKKGKLRLIDVTHHPPRAGPSEAPELNRLISRK